MMIASVKPSGKGLRLSRLNGTVYRFIVIVINTSRERKASVLGAYRHAGINPTWQ
jgi:hypothetical protein